MPTNNIKLLNAVKKQCSIFVILDINLNNYTYYFRYNVDIHMSFYKYRYYFWLSNNFIWSKNQRVKII